MNWITSTLEKIEKKQASISSQLTDLVSCRQYVKAVYKSIPVLPNTPNVPKKKVIEEVSPVGLPLMSTNTGHIFNRYGAGWSEEHKETVWKDIVNKLNTKIRGIKK